jgi:ABC-type lipoprotein release transport system permease subunit
MSSVKGSVDPVILAGRAPVGQNEALLGTETMERLGIALGDSVEIGGPLGQQTMVIVGRAIVPVLGSQYPDSGMIVPLRTMLDLGGTETVADIDVEPAVFVTLARRSDVAAVAHDLRAQGATLDGPFQQSGVSVLDELRTIPLFIGGFVVLLGALAAFHALHVTARRRRGDLAVMRALGHRPGQAASVIRWQGCVTAVTSLIIGLPIGLTGGRVLWRSIAAGANVVIAIDTPWGLVAAIALVTVVGTSLLLAAWPAWSARRRPPAIDLRAE